MIGRIAFANYLDSNSEDESSNLVIKDQYYPAHLTDFVVNDIVLDKNMMITGPNAAGKTTYLKTTVINIIYSQQVGAGFYSSCSLMPYTHIHSYLNIPDTSGRDSLFQAESRRCKEILATILENHRSANHHFCIFDELYSGTNPGEATKSAYAFLTYLSKIENVDFILTTHYIDMCERFESEKCLLIENWKMDVDICEGGDLEYKYTISKGISKVQGAIKVLKDMDYPSEIIDTIEKYDSTKKEEVVEKKKRASKKKSDL
jgi:DNA mismatch repair ATPase MutS